jgi:ABC-type transporter Mla subunit MlaD
LSWKEAETNEFIPTNRKAATALIAAAGNSLDKSRPLIVATLANINVLESPLHSDVLSLNQVSVSFPRWISNAGNEIPRQSTDQAKCR